MFLLIIPSTQSLFSWPMHNNIFCTVQHRHSCTWVRHGCLDVNPGSQQLRSTAIVNMTQQIFRTCEAFVSFDNFVHPVIVFLACVQQYFLHRHPAKTACLLLWCAVSGPFEMSVPDAAIAMMGSPTFSRLSEWIMGSMPAYMVKKIHSIAVDLNWIKTN